MNRTERIDPERVIETIQYSHPIFTEAGVASALRVCEGVRHHPHPWHA